MSKHGKPALKDEATDDAVKLKPILGIEPGLYLTVLYAIALFLVVFFLLFYPGIRNPGSYLVVSGVPARASVLVDGTYAGTSPCRIFVKSGPHTIEVTRPDFTSSRNQLTQPGRIFATLLVPQKRSLVYHLDLTDLAGLLSTALVDFIHNPMSPQILAFAVQDASPAMQKDTTGKVAAAVSTFVSNAMYFVTNEQQLRSSIYAMSSAWSRGGPLTLTSLLASASKVAGLAATHQNLPVWLMLSIDPNADKDMFQTILGSQWVKSYVSRVAPVVRQLAQETVASPGGPGVGSDMAIGGVVFRSVPAGTLLMGREDLVTQTSVSVDPLLPHPVQIDRFFLAQTEVTNAQYAVFLAANPEWKPSNLSALVQQGLTGDGYLAGWADDRYPAGSDSLPVTGVSWYAAEAYCRWLSGLAAAVYPDSTVQLPTEAQYEWAARGGLRGKPYPTGDTPGASVFFSTGVKGPGQVGSSGVNGYGLADMAGNVWEWCLDSFTPGTYALSSLDPRANRALASELPASTEKAVRGGSWANAKDTMRIYTRGSQPADWSTPYLGFRPALNLP